MTKIKVSCPDLNIEVFRKELFEHGVIINEEEEVNEIWLLDLSVNEQQLGWIESLQEECIEIIEEL